jgi:hypothetical protein
MLTVLLAGFLAIGCEEDTQSLLYFNVVYKQRTAEELHEYLHSSGPAEAIARDAFEGIIP